MEGGVPSCGLRRARGGVSTSCSILEDVKEQVVRGEFYEHHGEQRAW
jgi:hypothetical protein